MEMIEKYDQKKGVCHDSVDPHRMVAVSQLERDVELSLLPWWVSAAIAAVAFIGIVYVFPIVNLWQQTR